MMGLMCVAVRTVWLRTAFVGTAIVCTCIGPSSWLDNCPAQESASANQEMVGSTGLTQSEITFWRRQTAVVLGSDERRQELVAKIAEKYSNQDGPDAIRMLNAILTKGPRIGMGDGWFGASQSKFTWEWLCRLHQIDVKNAIPLDKFQGDKKLFERLDRNLDGVLAQNDLDWSDQNPWVRQTSVLNRVYRMIDTDGDNRVTDAEMEDWDKNFRKNGEAFSIEQFRNTILQGPAGYQSGDEPTPEKLLRGLFNGELGSIHEGPTLGSEAPDFTLTTQDGAQKINLREQHKDKPVVLVFGNFTCGPYRRAYPEIEDIHQRFKADANFLAIYVREAHPDDGWKMQSNLSQGIRVSQPKTFEERVSVARQCQQKLNYTMPLLVDEIDDTAGNLYSGMPARLYVIDQAGQVVYKGGRGPFGFNSGEMEQALAMALLEQQSKD